MGGWSQAQRERHEAYRLRRQARLARDAQILSALVGGMTQAEAAKAFGLSDRRVSAIANKSGCGRRHLLERKLKQGFTFRDSSAAREPAGNEGEPPSRARESAVPSQLPRDPVTGERYYDEEERDFLRACAEYSQSLARTFLNACDYLFILKSLGYIKPVA